MKVGVIIPVRNARPWIEEMLLSIQAQTHEAHAYLAEDWSDDGTHEWLLDHPGLWRGLERNPRRLGWAGGLNAAAALAFADGCDAVFTAAADDLLHTDCIARCATAMETGLLDFVTPYAQQFGGAHAVQASMPDVILQDFAVWPPLIDKGLFGRDLWEAVDGYSPEAVLPGTWGCAEDWDFWIKVWKAGYTRYTVIPQPLYLMRVHPHQLSDIRGQHHAATVELFRRLHPDLPWTEQSGIWPPRNRTTRRTA